MQTTVPDQVRGRIGASADAITGSANVLSMALAGVLAGWVGVRNVFLISGLMVVLAGLMAALIFRGVEPARAAGEGGLELEPTPVGTD